MKSILIDTSTNNLFVSFYDDTNKERIYFSNILSHNNHSENIINVIEEGLKTNNLEVKDFDNVILGYGPGSYTGLRVGMTVGKMISYLLNKNLYVISSLSFVSSGYFDKDGIYAIYNVAKKDYCYCKVVEVKNGNVNILEDDKFITDCEFNDLVSKYNAKVINQDNYLINEEEIKKQMVLVDNIHDLVPNYLRKANS